MYCYMLLLVYIIIYFIILQFNYRIYMISISRYCMCYHLHRHYQLIFTTTTMPGASLLKSLAWTHGIVINLTKIPLLSLDIAAWG